MKYVIALAALFMGLGVQAQKKDNTLLWKVTGNGLTSPSYLFGTMHLLCADDITLSDSLKNAIASSTNVYLELDMDNTMEMMGAMARMKMRNDTTLADLLAKDEYEQEKAYFAQQKVLLPFSMLETYKPFLAASMLVGQGSSCDHMISMEQLIMQETKKAGKKIKGMETMKFQMSLFDSIPYIFQAQQLLKMVQNTKADDGNEIKVLTEAYRSQKLEKMEDLIKEEDMGIKNFTEILLYRRNETWARNLDSILKEGPMVIAVGAGHLPGDRGLIKLLRKAGYKVTPVANNMIKQKSEIRKPT